MDLTKIKDIHDYVNKLGKKSISELSEQELIDWAYIGKIAGEYTYDTMKEVLNPTVPEMFEEGYRKKCFSMLREALEQGQELGLLFCENEDCGLLPPQSSHFEFCIG